MRTYVTDATRAPPETVTLTLSATPPAVAVTAPVPPALPAWNVVDGPPVLDSEPGAVVLQATSAATGFPYASG